MRIALPVLALAASTVLVGVAGCGGGGHGSGNHCTANVAGDTAQGSIPCQAGGQYSSASNLGEVILGGEPNSPLASVQFSIGFPGQPAPGSYTNNTPGSISEAVVEKSDGTTYVMGVGSNQTLHGSYTLGLTSVNVSGSAGGTKSYAVHGSIDMVLDEQGPAQIAGNEQLHATF